MAYGTLNTARSAINLVSSKEIADSHMNRFFKGVYRLKSSRPRYSKTRDVTPVIDKVAGWFPLESLNLQKLSEKLIILFALGTGHRMQTFSLIDIDFIKFSDKGAEIRVDALIKTSKVGTCQPCLILPFFNDKPEFCLARTLEYYLQVTEKQRNTKKLFLATKKPHREVGSQTLSRWTKSVLSQCGISKDFTAHSVRHASTSTALKNGLDLASIRSTVGWSKTSSVFARFYNRPIVSSNESFCNAVLRNNK